MKNAGSVESLMKISPLNDVYHEPKQQYTQKGGWFGLSCDEVSEKKPAKQAKAKSKKRS